MFGTRRSWARGLGVAVTSLAIGAFVALPAMAEPPSHGFHHHPVLGVPTNNHKPHAPHPVIGPPTNHHAPHPVPGPPTNNHGPHVAHKPHPGLNPFAPPLHS